MLDESDTVVHGVVLVVGEVPASRGPGGGELALALVGPGGAVERCGGGVARRAGGGRGEVVVVGRVLGARAGGGVVVGGFGSGAHVGCGRGGVVVVCWSGVVVRASAACT